MFITKREIFMLNFDIHRFITTLLAISLLASGCAHKKTEQKKTFISSRFPASVTKDYRGAKLKSVKELRKVRKKIEIAIESQNEQDLQNLSEETLIIFRTLRKQLKTVLKAIKKQQRENKKADQKQNWRKKRKNLKLERLKISTEELITYTKNVRPTDSQSLDELHDLISDFLFKHQGWGRNLWDNISNHISKHKKKYITALVVAGAAGTAYGVYKKVIIIDQPNPNESSFDLEYYLETSKIQIYQSNNHNDKIKKVIDRSIQNLLNNPAYCLKTKKNSFEYCIRDLTSSINYHTTIVKNTRKALERTYKDLQASKIALKNIQKDTNKKRNVKEDIFYQNKLDEAKRALQDRKKERDIREDGIDLSEIKLEVYKNEYMPRLEYIEEKYKN